MSFTRKQLGAMVRAADVKSLAAEVERLQAIVGRLPHTADGVPICPGDWIWITSTLGAIREKAWSTSHETVRSGANWPLARCYSTREAAENAIARGNWS